MTKTQVIVMLTDHANAVMKHYRIVNGHQKGNANKAFENEKVAMKKIAESLGVELTDEDIEASL